MGNLDKKSFFGKFKNQDLLGPKKLRLVGNDIRFKLIYR
jgi:hypothetical protein